MPMLDSLVVSPSMVKQIASIDEFRGAWQALRAMPEASLAKTLHVATIESIGSSTRIEGSSLSNAEVDAFLANLNARSFQSRDEQEVAGYSDILQLIFSNWTAMPFTESTIRQLHRLLLAHSTKDDWHRGDYKTLSNAVSVFDADGNTLGVVFQTAEPFDTPRLVADLVEWTNQSLANGPHHPLLVIGAFVISFLQIHPFQDGNGRLSRALTTLLLLKEGYAYSHTARSKASSSATRVSTIERSAKPKRRYTRSVLTGSPGSVFSSPHCSGRQPTCASRPSRPLPKQPRLPS